MHELRMSLLTAGGPPPKSQKEIRTMKEVPRTKIAAMAEPPNVDEEIRRRAYELFEARGGEDGHELEDWLRAEEEIRVSKTNAVAA
jgi:Protein of unknown function (DUF2934)